MIEYIEKTPVCFTSFVLTYNLFYKKGIFKDTYKINNPSIQNATENEGHVVSILIYRNGNEI